MDRQSHGYHHLRRSTAPPALASVQRRVHAASCLARCVLRYWLHGFVRDAVWFMLDKLMCMTAFAL
jgi:hypothetical protein